MSRQPNQPYAAMRRIAPVPSPQRRPRIAAALHRLAENDCRRSGAADLRRRAGMSPGRRRHRAGSAAP